MQTGAIFYPPFFTLFLLTGCSNSQFLRIQVSARSQEVWIETENGEIGERETRKLRLTDLRKKWTVWQSRSAIERTFHRPRTVSVRDPTVRTPISDHPGWQMWRVSSRLRKMLSYETSNCRRTLREVWSLDTSAVRKAACMQFLGYWYYVNPLCF